LKNLVASRAGKVETRRVHPRRQYLVGIASGTIKLSATPVLAYNASDLRAGFVGGGDVNAALQIHELREH
jgi:hypothetical protein